MAAAGFYKNYNYLYLTTDQVDSIDNNNPGTSGNLLSQLMDQAYAVTAGEIPANSIKDVKIASDAAIAFSKLAALTSKNILVGDTSNVAASVPVTGDIQLLNSGEMKLGVPVKNTTGGALAAGTLVFVIVNSTDGSLGVVASSKTAYPASHVLREAIADGATGYAYATAIVTGLNTNAGNVGDLVYLAAGGNWTLTAPSASTETVQVVGFVKVKDAVNGSIFFYTLPIIGSKLPTDSLQDAAVTPVKQDATGRTRVIQARITLPAPSGANQNNVDRYVMTMPAAGILVSAQVISSTATVSNATNRYEFVLRNNTQNVDCGSAVTNTNGSELVAETGKALTVDQNLTPTSGQVLMLRTNIKDTGAATNLSAANLRVELVFKL